MNKKPLFALLLFALAFLTACQTPGLSPGDPATAARIDREVDIALRNLYDGTPAVRTLAREAKAILVFPSVVKLGFIGGAEYGTGAMRRGDRTVGYYNLIAGSYGLQAGVQSYDYAMFFMTQSAIDYLNNTGGFEIGVGPSVVLVDAGVAKNLTTTTAKNDVYAFVFEQKGLMAGLGLQGSKITRITP
ncbi:lipid-binding SYLF domain-containing protein [Methylomagnum sp.]